MSAKRAGQSAAVRPTPKALWQAADSRRHERERKREAIILTAARAFRVRGYHNTSLDDIASELNVTKPTVYHYVSNKEQLLFECFRAGLSQIKRGLHEVSDRPSSARERLQHVVNRYIEAITSDFGWCMVQAENQDLSPTMSGKVRALKAEIDRGIRLLIKQGAADGSIRKCDPKIAAFALAGALNWIAYWYRSDASLSTAQIGERFVDLFDLGLAPRS